MSARPATMIRSTAACVYGNSPVLVWGGAGVGKTAKLNGLGESWGRHVETIAAGSREAVDFMGLPMEKNDEVVYSTLSWAKRLAAAPLGLLVCDEFTTAQSTFKAFLRIVQERYVGDFKLPDSVAIVALANPPEIAVDGVDLPAPVANRFIHLDWHVDREEWLNNVGTNFDHIEYAHPSTYLTKGTPADRARAVQMITGFLRHRPDLLDACPKDPEAQSGAWPSPRSWTNAMDALTWVPAEDEDVRDMILIGAVGKGAAVEILKWLVVADLYDPAAVLANPSMVKWTTDRSDRIFALLGAITTLATLEGDAATWRKALKVVIACAVAGRPDVAMPAARHLANSEHANNGLPAAFKDAFSDLFQRTGQVALAAAALVSV